MVDLADKYRITSNRESGLGRYDIMMEPLEKNKRAYVIEFKVHKAKREKDLEETAQNALQQIAEKIMMQSLWHGEFEKKISDIWDLHFGERKC